MWEEEKMPSVRIAIWAGLAALGMMLAVKSLPELRRYLRIRSM